MRPLQLRQAGCQPLSARGDIRNSALVPLYVSGSNAAAANTIRFAKWAGLHEARHDKIAAHLYQGLESPSQPSRRTVLTQLPPVSTMEAESQRPKEREGTISALNVAIEALNLAKEVSSITPAKAVFGSVSVILTTIKVSLPLAFR